MIFMILSQSRLCAGKLQVMRVAIYYELRVVHLFDLPFMQSLNFHSLVWMPSDRSAIQIR